MVRTRYTSVNRSTSESTSRRTNLISFTATHLSAWWYNFFVRLSPILYNQKDLVTEKTFALRGLRVIEFTTGGSAPWIGRHLSFNGAEVIRIESQAHPDLSRLYVPPWNPSMGQQPAMSPRLWEWHSAKRHTGLNVNTPAGRDVVHHLIDISDVVLVNLSASVTHRWGLQYDVLRKTNAALVMLSMPGFGMTGPYRDYVSFGATIEALSGLATSTGYPDGDPIGSGLFHFPDWLNGMQGLIAILSALDHRRRTGQGQFIDMSQMEVMVSAFGPLLLQAALDPSAPERVGNLSHVAAPHNAYSCKGNDQWCVIGCYSNEEWVRLCNAIGRPELGKDKRFATLKSRQANLEQIDAIMAEWTIQRDPMDVMQTLQAAGVHGAKIYHIKELTSDPNLQAQNFFTMLPHLRRVLKPGERRLVEPPEMGEVLATGLAIDLKEMPGHVWRSGPGWGADNRLIFRELMGLPAAQIDSLCKAGIIEGAA